MKIKFLKTAMALSIAAMSSTTAFAAGDVATSKLSAFQNIEMTQVSVGEMSEISGKGTLPPPAGSTTRGKIAPPTASTAPRIAPPPTAR